MTPFVDAAGAAWAADLFEATYATRRELILRDASQLHSCGPAGDRLSKCVSKIRDYAFRTEDADGTRRFETFHAKIVLADGNAAYVGSANFLHRSRDLNLECGFLLDGDAVAPVAILIDAVLRMFPD
jgi:phosphatidylserine/phosphatidylglycerophosphate/cardiolipin synthase-like enzyme